MYCHPHPLLSKRLKYIFSWEKGALEWRTYFIVVGLGVGGINLTKACIWSWVLIRAFTVTGFSHHREEYGVFAIGNLSFIYSIKVITTTSVDLTQYRKRSMKSS